MKYKNLIISIASLLVFVGVIGAFVAIFNKDKYDGSSLSHTHNYEIEIIYSDCTKGGSELKYCVYCGDIQYTDLPAKEHTLITVNAKDPTCSEYGYNIHQRCKVCRLEFDKVTIDKIDHNYADKHYCVNCGFFKELVEISGTWVLNNRLYVPNGFNYVDLIFTTPTDNCEAFIYINDSVNHGIYYSRGVNNTMIHAYSFGSDLVSEECKTISIVGTQYVPGIFYNWFINNATKIS